MNQDEYMRDVRATIRNLVETYRANGFLTDDQTRQLVNLAEELALS